MGRIRQHLRSNVVGYIALFFALSTGSAVALSGSNTVFTDDIANDTQPASGGNPAGGLQAADLRPGSVGSSEAANNSLAGADINESSLGQVPSALLGGFGRSNGAESCNPESGGYIACAVVTRNISRQARFLLIAQARAQTEPDTTDALGQCQIGTTAGPLLDTQTLVGVAPGVPNDFENVALVGVTDPFPPGQHSFGIDCRDQGIGSNDIEFREAGITAVAISPG
jgi:hypothetical protein